MDGGIIFDLVIYNLLRKTLLKQRIQAAFLVRQACISAIGCKSRMSVAVRIISQEQGCPS